MKQRPLFNTKTGLVTMAAAFGVMYKHYLKGVSNENYTLFNPGYTKKGYIYIEEKHTKTVEILSPVTSESC